jgi:CspA family cold shock protein
MSNSSESVVCQRCGRGYVMTDAYLDFLRRRGVKVKVPIQCMTCFLKDGPLLKQRGEIKWFNPRKRYGFIATDGGREIFVHQKQILNDEMNRLREGQAVWFHEHQSLKGPEAWNVELPDE